MRQVQENNISPSVTYVRHGSLKCFVIGFVLGALAFGVHCVHQGKVPEIAYVLHDAIFSAPASATRR